MRRKAVFILLGTVLAALVLAQAYRPVRSNPAADPASSFEAVARPPAEVSAMAKRACHDCHSNETVWPWYSKVAPVSWLVAQDVREGRAHLNFSEWGRLGPEKARSHLREMCEQVREREMPLWYYVPLHAGARPGPAEIESLCRVSAAGVTQD